MAKVKCICKTCGKEFFVVPSEMRRGGRKYCSPGCAIRARKNRVKLNCEVCGKEFETKASVVANGRGKCCSRHCANEAKKGKKHSPEHSAKQSGWQKGKKHSPETRAKMSASQKKAQNRPEIRARKSETHKGKKRTPETLAKMSASQKKAQNRPDVRGKKSASAKEAMNRPEVRAKHKEVMNRQEVRAKFSGENNPNWNGGTSFGKYCPKFDRRRREATRDFFRRKCLACGKEELENIIYNKRGARQVSLSVHHVDHDKEQGCNGKPFNLVPFCTNCHSKELHNEEEYKQYINKTLEEGFKWGIWNKEEYIKKVMY